MYKKIMARLINYFAVLSSLAVSSVISAEERGFDEKQPLVEGQTFASPGETFVATFKGDGFEIKETATGKVFKVSSFPPVYRAAWTKNAKTLATVEHIAGGTDCVCFSQAGENWVRLDIAPPNAAYHRYRVVGWDVGQDSVEPTYAVVLHGPGTVYEPGTRLIKEVTLNVSSELLSAYGDAFKKEPQMQRMATVISFEKPSLGPQMVMAPDLSPGAPIKKAGQLAIDTDGSGPSHGDPDQQDHCSGMIDSAGDLVVRKTQGHPPHLPAGCSEVNADTFAYGVAPKNFAEVNGGPLKVGDKMKITAPNGKSQVIQIADFGPVGGNGEVSYHEVLELGYQIKQIPPYGPIPSTDGVSTSDIPVEVIYKP